MQKHQSISNSRYILSAADNTQRQKKNKNEEKQRQWLEDYPLSWNYSITECGSGFSSVSSSHLD